MFLIDKKVALFKKLSTNHRESIYRMASRLYSMATIDKRIREFREFGLIDIDKDGRRIIINLTPKGKIVLELINKLDSAMLL